MNVDFPVQVQNRFSRNMLQRYACAAPFISAFNSVSVADPFDQAACHYRIDANLQGELLFQIKK